MIKTLSMYARPRGRAFSEPSDLYAHEVELLEGGTLDLATLRGRPTLIVNTASQCGYTPQYAGLQQLHDAYGPRGLQLLGCPSGDFAGQEYDEGGEIATFCQRNYGVSFPLTAKMSVRAKPHPLWRDLARQPGSKPPVWNFTKYLVGPDGRLVARWSTKVDPAAPEIAAAIEQALDVG